MNKFVGDHTAVQGFHAVNHAYSNQHSAHRSISRHWIGKGMMDKTKQMVINYRMPLRSNAIKSLSADETYGVRV